MALIDDIRAQDFYDNNYSVFPAAVDQLARKEDVGISTKDLVQQYHNYIAINDFESANALLNEHDDLKQVIWRAEDYNVLRDALVSVERTFNTYVEDYIVSVIRNKGDWNSTTAYKKYDLVFYTVNPSTGTVSSFIAMPTNEDVIDVPVGTLPTNTTWWRQITIRGEKGDTGTSFTVADSYPTLQALQNAFPTGNNNAYQVVADDYNIYIWSENESRWKSIGKFQTPLNIYTYVQSLPATGNSSTIYVVPQVIMGKSIYNTYGWIDEAWKFLGGVDPNSTLRYYRDFSLTTSGWIADSTVANYSYKYEYTLTGADNYTRIDAMVNPDKLQIAINAGFSPYTESTFNKVIFRSQVVPTSTITGLFIIDQNLSADDFPTRGGVIYDDTTGIGYYLGIDRGSVYVQPESEVNNAT